MSKTKICHITTIHERYDVRIFEKECRSLSAAGYDTTLIVNDEQPNEIKYGIRIISTHKKTKNRLSRMLKDQFLVYKLAKRENADIYHVHDPELLPICALLRKNAHVIFDSHEFTVKQILIKEYLPTFVRKSIAGIYAFLEKLILPKLSAIIVPTTLDGEVYFDRFGPPVMLINNYPSLREAEEIGRPGLDEDDKKGYACYLGSLTYARGLQQMIEAARLSGVQLVLGGSYSPEDILEDLNKMQSEEVGSYLGEINRKEVRSVLMKAGMGLSLLQDKGQYAHLDNLSTKVYEYMQSSLPVIISDFPYVQRLLKKYPFGIAVDPSDPEEIAQAMRFIRDNPETAKKMGDAGLRAVQEEFNWEKEAEKLIVLYRKLEEI